MMSLRHVDVGSTRSGGDSDDDVLAWIRGSEEEVFIVLTGSCVLIGSCFVEG